LVGRFQPSVSYREASSSPRSWLRASYWTFHMHKTSTESIAFSTSKWFTAFVSALRFFVAFRRRHVVVLCFSPRTCVSIRLPYRRWLAVLNPLHCLPSFRVCICTLLSVLVDTALCEIVCTATSGDQDTPAITKTE